MAEYLKVSTLSEVDQGCSKIVNVGDQEVALFNVDGKIYACGNTCLHRGGPLGEGRLEGNIVTCPWHAWKYDVTTGTFMADPSQKVPTYKTKVEGQDIYVEV